MGHRVTNHRGLCRNLHGHRYVAIVEIEGEVGKVDGAADEGMVVDFGVVKTVLKGWIDEHWDHGFMIFRDDPLTPTLTATGTKVIVVDFIPTAEHIAAALLDTARQLLDHRVVAVTVYETPNCSATCSV